MTNIAAMTLVGLVVLAVLIVVFMKVRRKDLLGAIMQKRQAGAKVISRADYLEGMEKIPVVLSLASDTLYYENPDLEASFELSRIDEIEYSDETATGTTLDDNHSVLRLRSHGAAFEFILDKNDAKKWMAAVPARATSSGKPHATAAV